MEPGTHGNTCHGRTVDCAVQSWAAWDNYYAEASRRRRATGEAGRSAKKSGAGGSASGSVWRSRRPWSAA